MEQAQNLARGLLAFIQNSPSCYHVTENFAEMLQRAGYCRLREQERWELVPGGRYFVTRNGSSIIAFRTPAALKGGFLMAAAHSDSPCFKIKENPEHPALQALKASIEDDAEKAKKYAQLLYCQGLLMANLPLEDPTAYTDLVCEMMR